VVTMRVTELSVLRAIAIVTVLLHGLHMMLPRSVRAVSARSHGTAPSRARLRSTGRGTTAGTAEDWSADRALLRGGRYPALD
jgi:hypothetical protein